MAETRQDLTEVVTERRKLRKLRFVRGVIVSSSFVLVLPLLMSATVDLLVGPLERLWWSVALVAVAVLASALLLFMLFGRVRLGEPRRPSPWLYWGATVLTVVVAFGALTPVFGMMILGAWVSLAVFTGPRPWGWWLCALGTALCAVLSVQAAQSVPVFVVLVVWGVLVVWSLFVVGAVLIYVRLWDVTNEALLEQRARARLAVSEERWRFSRDMHDLLGHDLSALVVKSELAERLLERDAARASDEMVQVQGLARKSLQQVRAAVRGYREVDLSEEVEAVRSILATNNIGVVVTGLPEERVPARTASLAARVVREGGTNVLRHSEAEGCRIDFVRAGESAAGPGGLVVEVANDRARGRRSRRDGGGLAELGERLGEAGGSLTAEATRDGGFLLRAFVPWSVEGADRGDRAADRAVDRQEAR